MAPGLLLSVVASALFALLTGYVMLLKPLDGQAVFAWRIVWSLPATILLIILYRRLPAFGGALRATLRQPRQAGMFLLLAALLGVQMWVFLWAPLNGYTLDASLGYFLLPIALVLAGRFFYKERLDIWQTLSVLCACIGIAHEIWLTRALSWVTVIIVIGYTAYFMLRRKQQHDQLTMFAMETLFLLPVAIVWLLYTDAFTPVSSQPLLYGVLLPGLGIISATAFACYLQASKVLPLSLFGILSYAEPIFIVLIAISFLGEAITVAQLGTYIPIWLAVGFTIVHSVRILYRRA